MTSFQQDKIQLNFYPYTYVRVSVMRSMLLKKQDYHKLMKMSVAEITKHLQDNDYGEDISSLATKHFGTELAESALNRNTERRFNKLRMVCDAQLKILVDAYLRRHDVYNLKTILRAKHMKMNVQDTMEMLVFAGALDRGFYSNLAKEDNMGNVLKKLSEKGFLPANTEGKASELKLLQIENMLDRSYYTYIGDLAEQIPVEGEIFRNFIKDEIDHLNILMILRLKREGLSKDQILKFLFFPKGLVKQSTYLQLLDMPMNDALDKIKEKHDIEAGILEYRETGSLIPIERDLKKVLLNRARTVSHKNILSVDVILSYMFAKEVETRNLMMLIKGKTLALDESFIEKGLVI